LKQFFSDWGVGGMAVFCGCFFFGLGVLVFNLPFSDDPKKNSRGFDCNNIKILEAKKKMCCQT